MRPGLRESEYFDILEAGEYIGIVRPIANDPDPVRTLKRQLDRMYHMVARRTIPHTKIGKRVFFVRTELDKWMRSGARHTWHRQPSYDRTTPE